MLTRATVCLVLGGRWRPEMMIRNLTVALAFCSLSPVLVWAAEVKIEIKSFIAQMGPASNARVTPPSDATKKALGFEGLTMTRTHALAFMYLTDDMFSENPPTSDPEVPNYRLWSRVKFDVTCRGASISNWSASPLESRFGKEGRLESVGETMKALSTVTDPAGPPAAKKKVSFSYAIKGRPNALTLPAFEAIRPRSCTWIWHEVSGDITCRAGKPAVELKLMASKFPSHRAWMDGMKSKDVPQGPFENLWKCKDANSGLVQ
jgi:hypothetical protein